MPTSICYTTPALSTIKVPIAIHHSDKKDRMMLYETLTVEGHFGYTVVIDGATLAFARYL